MDIDEQPGADNLPAEDPFVPPTTAEDAPLAPAAPTIAAEAEATHNTEHEQGLSDQDARVPGDAVPVPRGDVSVDAPKEPLGSLPDTATETDRAALPALAGGVLNTAADDAADLKPIGTKLKDAVIPTKPGGADLQDVLDDKTKDVVSRAPLRDHEGLINQLDLKWAELKHLVATIEGELEGELGEVLELVRSKL